MGRENIQVDIIRRKFPDLVRGYLVPRGLPAKAAADLVGLSVAEFRRFAKFERNMRPLPTPWIDTWSRRDVEKAIGFVYLVGFGDYIKIGWSREPTSRLCGLQSGVPEMLSVYGCFVGCRHDERMLHRAFDDLRLRGEWFRYPGAIADWIEAGCPTRQPKIIVEYDEYDREFRSTGGIASDLSGPEGRTDRA